MLTEIECAQQDVEAEQIGKQVPHIFRQKEVVGLDHGIETLHAAIFGRSLIGGHTAEHGVHPSCGFAVGHLVFGNFTPQSFACRRIVAEQNPAFNVGRKEIGKRYDCKKDNGQHIGQPLLECFHCPVMLVQKM